MIKHNNIIIFIFLFFLLLPVKSFSQKVKRIEILHANTLIGSEKKGKSVRKLIGDVVLMHEGVKMYCDSAYEFINENYFDAYGNVRIEQGDSILLTGRFLHYDINEKLASVKNNVRFTDKKMTLTTQILIYNIKSNIASYTSKAVIVDSANTLSSNRGYYYSSTKDLFFKENVKLKNKDFTLSCDTLQYNINSRVASFHSPTTISGEDTKIYTEKGWYNTEKRISRFRQNAYVFSKNQKIFGDILYYENESKNAEAVGNVKFIDTTEKSIIYGQYAQRIKEKEIIYITDSALFEKHNENDTMYLHADTLKIIKDSTGKKNIILAYNNVRSFSSNMSMKCDSFSYATDDSLIVLFNDPVLWTKENQITAKRIEIILKNNKLDKMFFEDDCFVIEKLDSIRFNQVKGRKMTAFLKNNDLYKMDVEGNAEAIYYLKDELKKYVGVNKIQSSVIFIGFKENNINTINFVTSPSGKVTPPDKTDNSELKLLGFLWRISEKPKSIIELFIK